MLIKFVPIFVVVVLFGDIYTVSASQPALVPQSVISQVGIEARFNCTTVYDEPIYWTVRPYGSSATHDIYIGEIFLLDDYGTSGRFSVEVNSILRRYDLLIQDIKQSDAGVYICIDERGLGKQHSAELIVFDTLTCQENQPQESYMGDNVFDLRQDTISVTCKMNYRGNIRPLFVWSMGGRNWNGTQGTELGIASSSISLIATSKLDGSNITSEVVIRDGSSKFISTGALWKSATILVKYAVLKNKSTEQCPGVENTLNCNPRCSYKLETVNGTQRCAVSYSTGKDVKWFHFYQSCAHVSETDSRYLIAGMIVVTVVLVVASFVFGVILGPYCCFSVTSAIGRLAVNLRFKSEQKNKVVERTPENQCGTLHTAKCSEESTSLKGSNDERIVFIEKTPSD